MNFNIGNFEIGSGRTFLIAEIGNNHNGDIDRAINMIDRAKSVGADCVKFQMRQLDQVYRERSLKKSGDDLGTEYVIDLLKRFELSVEQHKMLFDYCVQNNILYLCTAWDKQSVKFLENFGVLAYKVASADLTNLPLLNVLSQTQKPLILSTGMSSEEEIKITTNYLNKLGVAFALLHCNSTYPAPLHDINLKWINSMKNIHPLIGYSGHERGINVSLGAASLEACIIERHFTLDRNMEGPDHAASLTQEEFSLMVNGIREIEQALGQGTSRYVSQGEMINRENLGKSLVASKPIKKGTLIKPEHIKVRSPGQGLSPHHYEKLLGRNLNHNMESEDFFFPSDLNDNVITPREYSFSRSWGIPVRYHDFREYESRIKPDLWEFHLSYSDMNLNPNDFLDGPYDQGFVVHAPELFEGSHLMDLASPSNEYRQKSIKETQRVIDITRKLKKFFPSTSNPLIVANIGGFTMDKPIPINDVTDYYKRFAESVSNLDDDGVELIPQTMAPFPWHFGGQRYQNIFVRIDEIVEWCKKLNLRMCFDVSHSYLTCNHLNIDFYKFAELVGPFSAHLHLGDALGLNGEGLQIGDGDIDFVRLASILKATCPNASFIPEIWQGHKNRGEGFWKALEDLENLI